MGATCCNSGPGIPNPTEERMVLAELKRNHEQQRAESTLLFLGVGGTGKSTFFKQLTRIHGGGISDRERRSYGVQIQEQSLLQMKLLTHRMMMTSLDQNDQGQKFQFERNEEVRRAIETLGSTPEEALTPIRPELVDAVRRLWADPEIKKGFEDRARLCIFDCSGYFWDNLDRVGRSDYIPTDEDCINLRNPTTGMAHKTFSMNDQRVKIVDVGGQRSERRKWMHLFDGVTAVIFVASLSSYDEFLYEDHQQNVMLEQLMVYEQMINTPWFTKTPIILFLNKNDLFTEKIAKKDMTDIWPQYRGGCDYKEALQYIKGKFKRRNQNANRVVYTHVTCARNKDNVEKVFTDVTHTVVERQLKTADLV